MYKVNCMKYFHSGNLIGLSVDCSVRYPTLERATEVAGDIMKFTVKTRKDLQGNDVSYHCIHITKEE